jgi:hypothetical protein
VSDAGTTSISASCMSDGGSLAVAGSFRRISIVRNRTCLGGRGVLARLTRFISGGLSSVGVWEGEGPGGRFLNLSEAWILEGGGAVSEDSMTGILLELAGDDVEGLMIGGGGPAGILLNRFNARLFEERGSAILTSGVVQGGGGSIVMSDMVGRGIMTNIISSTMVWGPGGSCLSLADT